MNANGNTVFEACGAASAVTVTAGTAGFTDPPPPAGSAFYQILPGP